MDNTELSRLSRLTAILTILQGKSIVTSTELSLRFEVSIRTIYRDIKSLIQSGVPIHTIEGKGYTLVDGYSLPPVMFTSEEANALITASKIIAQNRDQSLVVAHDKAIQKIRAVMRGDTKMEANLIEKRVANLSNLYQLRTSDNLLAIQKAVANRKVLSIGYADSQKQITDRNIEPMATYYTKDNWVAIGWCRLRNAFREFRLDRISTFSTLPESFDKRPFDLLAYFLSVRQNNQNTPDIGLSQWASTFDIINQKISKMDKQTLDQFYMIGVFTKTVNAPGRAEKDIPALWKRFMDENVKDNITNAISEEVICAYTEYEGDHLKPYTTVVGYKVSDLKHIPAGMKGLTISRGEYTRFIAKGDLKGPAVIRTWMDVWRSGVDRSYTTDFEVYGERAYPLDNGEADIYIATK